jgi:hypothetical protein
MGRGLGGVKTREDEPIGAVMHVYMKTAQGNSLCSYLYLKLTKTSWFSFYLLCFFFYKIREQKCGTGSAGGGGGWGVGTSGWS